MRVILQDRRSVVRTALPTLLAECNIDVIAAVCCDVDLLQSCGCTPPDGVVIELDDLEWNASALCDDLHTRHPRLRVVGIGDTDAAVDVRLTVRAGPQAVADALLSRAAPPSVSAPHGRSQAERRQPSLTAGIKPSLTARQAQVLSLISQGNSAEQIAAALQVSTSTVTYHKREIFARLGARSQAQAVRTAMQRGLLRPVRA